MVVIVFIWVFVVYDEEVVDGVVIFFGNYVNNL